MVLPRLDSRGRPLKLESASSSGTQTPTKDSQKFGKKRKTAKDAVTNDPEENMDVMELALQERETKGESLEDKAFGN